MAKARTPVLQPLWAETAA